MDEKRSLMKYHALKTSLTVYKNKFCDQAPSFLEYSEDRQRIQSILSEIGVRFEQWATQSPLSADTSDADILKAYEGDIVRLKQEGGYSSVDVVHLFPDNPNKTVLREKFLSEHIHTEDEVRFFVQGGGAFYLHPHNDQEDKVYAVICTAGDLISVPARVKHWFDMGEEPHFTAIRLFERPDGWIAEYTGDALSQNYPLLPDLCLEPKTPLIVLDIEGTITDIDFVAQTLFPYARKHMPDFLQTHKDNPAVKTHLEALRVHENKPDLSLEESIAVLDQWMATDQKIGILKALQGMVWREGYESGAFQGHLYEEVLDTLKVWVKAGKKLFIYSSGSVEAQKLLLGYSVYGDVTPLFSGFFDTEIGAKTADYSYKTLSERIHAHPHTLTFYSDNPLELQAAQNSGLSVIEIKRKSSDLTPSGQWICQNSLY
jgi:enolase-phosphatase E1